MCRQPQTRLLRMVNGEPYVGRARNMRYNTIVEIYRGASVLSLVNDETGLVLRSDVEPTAGIPIGCKENLIYLAGIQHACEVPREVNDADPID